MPAITLKAHFDGENIKLDEPYQLTPNAPLLVTVLSPVSADPDLSGWYEFSARGLATAYGDDEPEYSEADLIP